MRGLGDQINKGTVKNDTQIGYLLDNGNANKHQRRTLDSDTLKLQGMAMLSHDPSIQ